MPKLNKKDNLRSGQVRTVPKNNKNINNKSKCQLKSLQKDDNNLTKNFNNNRMQDQNEEAIFRVMGLCEKN